MAFNKDRACTQSCSQAQRYSSSLAQQFLPLRVQCVSLTDPETTSTTATFTAPPAQLQATALLHPGGGAHVEHMHLHTSTRQRAAPTLGILILLSSF